MLPGDNAAPMHPCCRCSVAAYSDRADYDQWLTYLEMGGTTKSWDALKGRVAEIKKKPKKALEKFGNSDIIKFDEKAVREWYYNNSKNIVENIPASYSDEEKARQSFEERNNIKYLAREMMSDEEKRLFLYETQPIKSFEELVKAKMDNKEMSREEAIKDIFKTAEKTNAKVNRIYSLE